MPTQANTKLFSMLSFVVIFAVSIIAVLLWQSFHNIHVVTDKVAINNANNMLASLARYRDFYADFVVPRGKAVGIQFSHNYAMDNKSLPFPATFIKDFADKVTTNVQESEMRIRFVSDLPFPWRNADGSAILDSFEQEAMKQARINPAQSFWRIEERNGVRTLRISRPDVLNKQGCVDCHNSYLGTPKTDWKLGDVRGIFSLSVTLDRDEISIKDSYLNNFALLGVSILALLILLSWSLLQLRQALNTAQSKNIALENNNAFIEAQMVQTEYLNELLRSEQGKLESVLSAVSDMIIVIDRKGIIQSVNHSVISLFGYWQDELIGQSVNKLMPDEIACHHDAYLQRYWENSLEGIALPPRRVMSKDKQGNLIEVELEVRSIHLSDQMLFVGVLRDIRAQLEIEKNLKNARDDAIRTASLKSQFLANMSHELRTPLNGMISMSQLLEEDLKTPVMKDRAKVISSSAKHLLSIVNDILDFSRIQSGKFELYPKPFDIESWLMDSLAIHLQIAKDKKLGLSLEIQEGVPKKLMGDTLRLSQVLHNLLSNSLKFTSDGSVAVSLSLLDIKQQDNQSVATLSLSVKDSGMGMSENALTQLFQPFSQVDNSASRVHGGTGLGLMISCELAQMMQGKINVTSKLGEGSVFTVIVRLAMVDDVRLSHCLCDISALDKFANDEAQHHDMGAEGEGVLSQPEVFDTYHLLVVEDNPVNQKVVAALLKRFGYLFDIANQGEEALEMLSRRHYDLILMDCQMPVLDGYETTRKLRHREQGSNQHIPVIALTAHAFEGEDQKCYAAGMDDYLTKPLDHGMLKNKITQWLMPRSY